MFSWVPPINSAKRLQKAEDRKEFRKVKVKIRKAIEKAMRDGLYEYASFPEFSIWGEHRRKIIVQLRKKGYAVGDLKNRDHRYMVIAWGKEKENVIETQEAKKEDD